ncbi:hypothetical protein [Desulfolutivibrio sp.]|uniref:hypothetical protein n=1 Tax=Desulfolutivibrio sp. TaxID=2773296 RepID=UPI002F9668AA
MPPMEWFAIIGAGVALLLLVALFVGSGRRHDGGSVPGQFDFDRFKSRELGKRGLHDKTKWG